MTPEQQRIAIAQACGWKIHPKDRFTVIPPNSPHSVQPLYTIPNYPEDLNAMHEAEEMLLGMCDNDPQADLWISYLANLVLAAPCCLREHATAAQRAEAFLKTLNLWKP